MNYGLAGRRYSEARDVPSWDGMARRPRGMALTWLGASALLLAGCAQGTLRPGGGGGGAAGDSESVHGAEAGANARGGGGEPSSGGNASAADAASPDEGGATASLSEMAASKAIAPQADPKPVRGRYRGFNFTGMFKVEYGMSAGFPETDFELLQKWGFNYVRLPLDYLAYSDSKDWTLFDSEGLKKIDRAIEYGQRYGIHIDLNLHQAPGYCVYTEDLTYPPGQDLDLWTDSEAQDVFVEHWRMFAHRYKDIAPEYLSFNLVNEPINVDEATYLPVMQLAIDAIREVTPDRPVVLDGVDGARNPLTTLKDTSIIQSLHVYDPFRLTHYRASWAEGSDTWPVPEWPPTMVPEYLFGSYKPDLTAPFTVRGDFPAGTKVALDVKQVSYRGDLVFTADGEVIYEHSFEPGPGDGEWETVVYEKYVDDNGQTSGVYQNIYNREYSRVLTSSASELSIGLDFGDWLTFNSITFVFPEDSGKEPVTVTPGLERWDLPQAIHSLDEQGRLHVEEVPEGFELDYDLRPQLNQWILDWVALKKTGVEVIVGEFGVYNQTPHPVAMGWLKDALEMFEDEGFGWAGWAPMGEFGVLDSGRSDVDYESYEGHELDREMLDLLQAH